VISTASGGSVRDDASAARAIADHCSRAGAPRAYRSQPLVGIGTRLGSGCTSGHGVCGVSRLSPRSLVATLTFLVTGALTVALVRWLGGGA
jgi:uncharacterized membrane protein YedE/YeeE